MTAGLQRRLLTVDEYLRMAEVGILREDDRVELIQGELVETAPTGSPHGSTIARLSILLRSLPAEQGIPWVQSGLELNRLTQVMPDLSLLRPRSDFYFNANPRPEDVLLLIEVSDSSLAYDREIKLDL